MKIKQKDSIMSPEGKGPPKNYLGGTHFVQLITMKKDPIYSEATCYFVDFYSGEMKIIYIQEK